MWRRSDIHFVRSEHKEDARHVGANDSRLGTLDLNIMHVVEIRRMLVLHVGVI